MIHGYSWCGSVFDVVTRGASREVKGKLKEHHLFQPSCGVLVLHGGQRLVDPNPALLQGAGEHMGLAVPIAALAANAFWRGKQCSLVS